MRTIYMKPVGLVHGGDACDAFAAGLAGRLGGYSMTGFTHVAMIERNINAITTTMRAYAVLSTSRETVVRDWLERIETPRAPMAGFDWTRPLIMGIVNVTPDSFSDGGLCNDTPKAIAHGRALAEAGADIVDIGGESTRPGAKTVDTASELARVIPVIEGLKSPGPVLSVDTRKAEIMGKAVASGARIVNDVSSLTYDPQAHCVMRSSNCHIVLMHSEGTPETMQNNPHYDNVLFDVYDALEASLSRAQKAGIAFERLLVDPGIGFGKTFEHNLTILKGLTVFHGLGTPLVLGVSRKSFIGTVTGESLPRKRVAGSISAALTGLFQGVHVLRVHDVLPTIQAVAVWRRMTETTG